jgi:hypothetical protein
VHIDFSAAIMHYINVGHRMAAGLGLPSAVEPLTIDAGVSELASAESDLSLCWARLLILGSSEAIRAAQDWRSEAWQLESFARGRRNDPAEFVLAEQTRRVARSRFYKAVRADLGVTTGDIPADLGVRMEQGEQSGVVTDVDGG